MSNDEEFDEFIDEMFEELDREQNEESLLIETEVQYDYDEFDDGETVEQVIIDDKKYIDIEYYARRVEELETRLSNCIEPKFKIGQEVWFVNTRNGYDAQIERGKIENLRIFALKSKIQINYRICDSNCSWYDRHSYRQKELFATEEEAKKHLEELKNGKV